MLTIREIYKIIKESHRERVPFIYNWRKSPYTFLKMKFYQTVSAVLVYWWLKTNIKPNTITVLYGLAGLLGGGLLAIPTRTTVILAAIIFFSKSILDVADGTCARLSGQTSDIGHILDSYGAHLGALGLQIGLGFFVAHKSQMALFYYLTPIIPLCYAANLLNYTKMSLLEPGEISKSLEVEQVEVRQKEVDEKVETSEQRPLIKYLGRGWMKLLFLPIKVILDNRARSVDFICLLAVIEMYTPLFVTWIIFLLFVAKQILIFVSTFYQAVACDWVGIRQVQISAEIRNAFENSSKKNRV
jgi:hypothetical protein